MKRILTLLFLLPLFAAGQCDTVTGLTATGVGHASATISFTAPSASLYFVLIYNGTRQNVNDPGGPYPALVTAPLNSLTPSTAYTYTIVRYCSGSDSAESSDYYFTTTAPPCDTVTNVAASVTSNSVSITSTAAAYGDSYVIYYVRDGQTDTTTEAGADEDFQLSNLRPNTVYWYQIGTICGSDTTRNTRRSFTTSNSPAYTPSYNFGWQYKRLAPDSTLNLPTMASPSLRNGKNDKAAFIYDTVYQAPAVFNPLTQDWDYLSTQDSSVVIVATVSALSSYGGNASTVIVTDSLRGGFFNYYSSGLTTDNGIVFSATGKGAGYWKRDVTQSEFISTDWFNVLSNSGDQTSKVIAAYNAAIREKKGLLISKGTFEIDSIRVANEGIVIRGYGDSSVLKKLTGSTTGSGLIQIVANNCTVENITLIDNGIETKLLNANHAVSGVTNFQMVGFKARNVKAIATNGGSSGIFVGRYLHALIENCYVENTASTTADSLSFGIAFHSSSSVGEATDIKILNNTVVGFFNGINSYGTGRRYETYIGGNIVTDAQRFGITGYHSTRSRIANNRVDRCQVGIWSDSGSEPEAADSGYNRGYGNVVTGNQAFRNSLYGFETEEFLGGVFSGNTADSNYIGFAFGGGTGGASITGNVATRSLKYNFYFEKSVNPVENYIQDITFTGNVAKLAGEHGIKIGGIQRGLIISGNIITDNGALSKNDTTLHYAGIWIGQDNGPDGTTPEQGTKTKGAIISNNVIGDSIPLAVGTGGNGYQYYGIFLQDTSINGRVFISNNHFESDKPYHIVANGNRITLTNNLFVGDATVEYDSTISNTVLNYGYRDGEIDYASDSSLTLHGAYTQTHLKMRGTHIWIDNDNRIRYNNETPTNNRDGHLVLDERDNTYTVRLPAGNASAPGDGATLYFGDNASTTVSATAAINNAYISDTGTITKANIFVYVNGTLGSNEASTFYVRKNNTTDYLISSAVTMDALTQNFTVTGLNIPVNGDFANYVQIKWVTPSWATNPTNVRITVILYVEKD